MGKAGGWSERIGRKVHLDRPEGEMGSTITHQLLPTNSAAFYTNFKLPKGASKGQVWTRHLAPAAPAFTRPSLPSQCIACSTLPFDSPLAQCASPVPPWLGQETRACWFWALSPGHAVGVLQAGSWHLFVFHVDLLCLGCARCCGPHSATHLSIVLTRAWGYGGERRSEVNRTGRCHWRLFVVLVVRVPKGGMQFFVWSRVDN